MSDLYELIKQSFSKNNWRITPNLKAILNTLEDSHTLLGIKDIQKILKQKNKKIDYSTIYRILSRLKKTGLVHEFEDKWKSCTHPHNRSDEHHFLICNKCKKVEEIFLDYKDSISEQLFLEKKFKLKRVHLGFLGLCKNCS